MMKKKLAILAAAAAVFSILFFVPYGVSATSQTEDNAKELEEIDSQLDSAKGELDDLQSSLDALEQTRQDLVTQKSSLEDYISELDAVVDELSNSIAQLNQESSQLESSISQLEDEIDDLNSRIDEKQDEIEETRQALEAAQEDAASQYDSMKIRIRYMYEMQGSMWALEALISSDGFSDFLDTADYVNRVYEYDQQLWTQYLDTCDYISECSAVLEEEEEALESSLAILDEYMAVLEDQKMELASQKASVASQQSAMESLIDEKSAEVADYESDIETQEAYIAEYESYIATQNSIIAQLEEARRAKSDDESTSYDGGMFCLPIASYTRISDDYGYRMHPVLNEVRFHNGVDFAAPAGTAIYAAYDGTVAAAAYNSSMGNYIMIDHGSGLMTIYMHASALYVSTGQQVTKGQTIAAVGTTGMSTGNHLHFGVTLNGEYVSPWNYLSL